MRVWDAYKGIIEGICEGLLVERQKGTGIGRGSGPNQRAQGIGQLGAQKKNELIRKMHARNSF